MPLLSVSLESTSNSKDKAMEYHRVHCEWKTVLIEALLISHCYKNEHDQDARKALNDLLCWERSVALDPSVSEEARKFMDIIEKLMVAHERILAIHAADNFKPNSFYVSEAVLKEAQQYLLNKGLTRTGRFPTDPEIQEL